MKVWIVQPRNSDIRVFVEDSLEHALDVIDWTSILHTDPDLCEFVEGQYYYIDDGGSVSSGKLES